MCGISGYFGYNLPPMKNIEEASSSLNHRGPDDNGIFIKKNNNKNIVLIHNRLAIIDLESRSNQPFREGKNLLIYNGEIYNFVEIRDKLKLLGYSFKTKSDTEVLAKALIHWKEKALNFLEGMWSFAWYNEETNELTLSRDRFGEKPLYYLKDKDSIYFGSEIKSLAKLSGRWPKINKKQLLRYLINGYKSLYKSDDTFFEEVQELKSGNCMVINSKEGYKTYKYWSPKNLINNDISYSEIIEKTRNILINSVKIRLRSDVPLAFCMSGGIDSNSLISIAKNILGYEVHGFTVKNQDERYEESNFVDIAVENLKIKHDYIKIEKNNFLENLKKLIKAHDSPIYTLTYFLHWQLMQKISMAGYKVCISGTGADELFTGYYDHHNFYLADIKEDKELYKKSRKNWQKFIEPIVRNPFLKNPDIFIENPKFRNHIYLNNEVFASFLHKDWNENFQEKNFGKSILRNRMMNELFHESVPVILHEDDLNSMYFSIENRSPFLDRELFDFASTIPTKYLIQDGKAKSVLRDAMKTIVPESILQNRKKVGFNAPIFDLVDINDIKVRETLLEESTIFEIIKKEKVESLLKEEKLANSSSKFLFSLINAKIFLDIFEGK
tara:strand:+ start:2037 stop:3869 length:1833 start_codon:yes stop_codon:yes gene_type:complete